MKIEFVNHASLIFSYDGINLITDPWLEGSVFQDGWSHLSKTKFPYSEFNRITHIWFSHEHPDHFFPPNVKSIPEELRKNITVLYQQTNDKKVIEFCKKLNFKNVIELLPEKEVTLTSKFKIINGPFNDDSWLCIKTDKCILLNTNDCVINQPDQAKEIHTIIGNINILLTQFSYAGKCGNANEPELRQKAIEDKRKQIKLQFDVFKPTYFIPIASYIWFSHEENFYMNDHICSIDSMNRFSLQHKVEPIILYPNDSYELNQTHDNTINIQKYLADMNGITITNTTKTISVTMEQLTASSKEWRTRLKNNHFLAFSILALYPIKFHLSDLNTSVKLSCLFGLKKTQDLKTDTNIVLTSEVLNYCLKFYWGFGTTVINARFQTNSHKDMNVFNIYNYVTNYLNHGVPISKVLYDKVAKKIKSVFGKK